MYVADLPLPGKYFLQKKFPARHFPLPACPAGPGRLALRLSMRYTARHTLNARIRLMQDNFSHLDKDGNITMVDVGAKPDTQRVAIAEAIVELSPNTLKLLKECALPKGDVLTCAKVGGIMAAKRTSELIPLCHPLNLNLVDVRFEVRDTPPSVRIEAETRTTGPTGVEMEAIIAAQTAAAVIYDMCKAVQRDIVISRVRLLFKDGGRSGAFHAKPLD